MLTHKGVRFPLLPQNMKNKKVKKFRIGDLLIDNNNSLGIIVGTIGGNYAYEVHFYSEDRIVNCSADFVEYCYNKALDYR